MPLINRIEIANFMNAKRLDPWRADWPHQVFELNGENAAISITNGRGKSTLVHLVFAMLTWERRDLGELRKTHFAPLKTGRFTHLRAEMKVDVPDGDLLMAAGGEISGRTMVFGMYGNSGPDDNWLLYCYRGRLEDCAVANVLGTKVTLIGNDAFLDCRSKTPGAFPASHKEISVKQWRDTVGTWFDMAALEQQLDYQRCKAGEGGNTYFDAPRLHGMSYATSLFYDRLAPELLHDVMGSEREDDERGIEDTIHINASSVIRARRETAQQAERLVKAGEVLAEYAGVKERAAAALTAKNRWDARRDELSVELAVLKNVVVDQPLPGVPRPPASELPDFAKHLVLQDDQWFLPDRALRVFTGEEPSKVNERAERTGITPAKAVRGQLLEVACDSFSLAARGPAGKLYSRADLLTWLKKVERFAEGWTTERAFVSVNAVFDWAEAHADTNPARRRHRELTTEIGRINAEYEQLGVRRKSHQAERDSLWLTSRQIGLQQQAYQQMSRSGLFSADELLQPAHTGAAAKAAKSAAQEESNRHREKTAALTSVYESWLDFGREHQDASPGVVADTLEAAVQAARAAEQEVAARRNVLVQAKPALTQAVKRADEVLKLAEKRANGLADLKPMAETFTRIFPDEDPDGLADKVSRDLRLVVGEQRDLEKRQSELAKPLADLTAFRREHPDADPGQWLAARNERWAALGVERKAKEATLADARQRRADLDVAAVAAGMVARKALEVAGGAPDALHLAVERMALPAARREEVLSLFSALLFSPVYATLDEAATAAAKLAAAQVEAPVFVFDELEQFCRDAVIAYRNPVAHTWLVGRRTRPVDCLLDPTLVEREKADLDQLAAKLAEQIEAIDGERAGLSPESEDSKLAQRARDAVTLNVEAANRDYTIALVALANRLPELQRRASDEARDAIRAAIQWRKLLGDDSEAEVVEALANARLAAAMAMEAQEENVRQIDLLDTEVRAKSAVLNDAMRAALAVAGLRLIQKFVDDPVYNAAFMAEAPARKQALADALKVAEDRAGFDFEAADLFAKGGEEKSKATETKIGELTAEIRAIEDLQPKLTTKVGALNEEAVKLVASMRRIDDFARKLTDNYRSLALALQDPVPKTLADLERNFLYGAAPGLREATQAAALIRMLDDLAEDPTITGSDGVGTELAALTDEHKRSVQELEQAIDRVIKDKQRLNLTDRDVLDLQRAKVEPEWIDHLHRVTKENYDKNIAANATAQEHLQQEWAELAKWLQTFTKNLSSNLHIMKEQFAPPRGPDKAYTGGGFEIEGRVADITDVQATLTDIVDMVERDEALAAKGGEDDDRDLRQQRRTNLRTKIRTEFYRRVIIDPSIKVYIPTVSLKPLVVEKNMLSSGQSIAMTLLWIVKMADYVTQRDLRRNNVRGAQLKHLQAAKSSFVIIDGAFSHLSDKALINDVLAGITKTRGRFQLVVTGHDPNYQNDYARFPVFLVGRELNDNTMFVAPQSNELLSPETRGLHEGAMATQRVRALPDQQAPLLQ